MEYFAGLDVSMAETHVCIVTRNGAVIRERRHPTGVHIAHKRAAALDPLENTIGAERKLTLEVTCFRFCPKCVIGDHAVEPPNRPPFASIETKVTPPAFRPCAGR